ncbi:hypothetical protein [Planobispora takensis]|uniref:Uncharacterized protein n=1 Tax=Planobispora takensis TaxID=1367882 RepID=A0A8J3T681_9ACTN|nr:hypothetical protein [Planobispora takensis]GII01744.1 hypothetical protein Pta02_37520 [Planobispora takensis]
MSTDRLADLVLRAAVACQCRTDSSTSCGRPHKPTGGICLVVRSPEKPLHIVPRADVPLTRAATLPTAELMVLCDACHAALLAERRRARTRAVPVPDALF